MPISQSTIPSSHEHGLSSMPHHSTAQRWRPIRRARATPSRPPGAPSVASDGSCIGHTFSATALQLNGLDHPTVSHDPTAGLPSFPRAADDDVWSPAAAQVQRPLHPPTNVTHPQRPPPRSSSFTLPHSPEHASPLGVTSSSVVLLPPITPALPPDFTADDASSSQDERQERSPAGRSTRGAPGRRGSGREGDAGGVRPWEDVSTDDDDDGLSPPKTAAAAAPHQVRLRSSRRMREMESVREVSVERVEEGLGGVAITRGDVKDDVTGRGRRVDVDVLTESSEDGNVHAGGLRGGKDGGDGVTTAAAEAVVAVTVSVIDEEVGEWEATVDQGDVAGRLCHPPTHGATGSAVQVGCRRGFRCSDAHTRVVDAVEPRPRCGERARGGGGNAALGFPCADRGRGGWEGLSTGVSEAAEGGATCGRQRDMMRTCPDQASCGGRVCRNARLPAPPPPPTWAAVAATVGLYLWMCMTDPRGRWATQPEMCAAGGRHAHLHSPPPPTAPPPQRLPLFSSLKAPIDLSTEARVDAAFHTAAAAACPFSCGVYACVVVSALAAGAVALFAIPATFVASCDNDIGAFGVVVGIALLSFAVSVIVVGWILFIIPPTILWGGEGNDAGVRSRTATAHLAAHHPSSPSLPLAPPTPPRAVTRVAQVGLGVAVAMVVITAAWVGAMWVGGQFTVFTSHGPRDCGGAWGVAVVLIALGYIVLLGGCSLGCGVVVVVMGMRRMRTR